METVRLAIGLSLLLSSPGAVRAQTPSNVCIAAAAARASHSPSALALERQCAATRPTMKLGRVAPKESPQPERTLCQAAADARARNSPAAPGLERQCRETGGIPGVVPPVVQPAAMIVEGSEIDEVVDLLSAYRVAVGLPPASRDPDLAAFASRHVVLMAGADSLSHQSAGEGPLGQRLSDAGYLNRKAGELLYGGPRRFKAQDALEAWRQSPIHDAQLRLAGPIVAGVSAADAAPGSRYERYWTLVIAEAPAAVGPGPVDPVAPPEPVPDNAPPPIP
jgi:uncharacterized protein YkwD